MAVSTIWAHLLRAGASDCAQRVKGRDLVDVHVLLDGPTRDALDMIITTLWASTPRRLSRSEIVRELVAQAAVIVASDADEWRRLPPYDQFRRLQEVASSVPSPRPVVAPWS